ncbi:hypothetical protein [Rhodococcus sp. ACT016]|uniref:hypothetical protein n=1 Tax=Rhodococcus sp. ACT016 TaxID=3134808 RepID=UPI003D2E7A0F
MMWFSLKPVAEDGAIRSVRSGLIDGKQLAGSVIAVRPISQGLHSLEHSPRQMVVIALDNGQWCFAWLIGGHAELGARARIFGRPAGEKYPIFTLIRQDAGELQLLRTPHLNRATKET